jgi:aryl sulfotransferase
MDGVTLPTKTRDFHNHHFDSTTWNDVVFRDDDIVISTYAKAGTTWVQQIVSQLIFSGETDLPVAEMSPWVDLRVPPKEVKLPAIEAQTHRRFLKTHLPVDALVFSPKVKYLYIGRDGRDVVWSMYNHHKNANAFWYEALNDTPGRVGPPIDKPNEDITEYFREWMAKDGHPFWPFWENART